MGQGTARFGKRRKKTHTLCVRCRRRSFHLQKSRCGACCYPSARVRRRDSKDSRGTGRMRYLRYVAVSNFVEGTKAAPRKKRALTSS